MPSTITTYYTFQPATKARSSQVNTNFSNYRGDILPINEATATASDNTHHLGSSDHRWNTAYLTQIQFSSATTTATCIAKTDTSAAAGAFTWEIEGTEVARMLPTGITKGSVYQVVTGLTFTASGLWTCPAYVNTILVAGCGGGGGGGGGGGDDDGGGAGGGGTITPVVPLTVTPGTVYTITIGLGGAGGTGSAALADASGSPGVVGGDTKFSSLLTFYGGRGGAGGHTASAGTITAATITGGIMYTYGGAGGLTASTSASAGETTISKAGGTGGASGGAGGGGGGGGGGSSLFGVGGYGGTGPANGVGGSAGGTATGYGAGGGGGSGSGQSAFGGGPGGDGSPGILVIYIA